MILVHVSFIYLKLNKMTMKKIMIAAAIFMGIGSTVFAQQPAAAAAPAAKMHKVTKTTHATKMAPARAAKGAPVKADGTPDMRYKANKAAKAASVAGPKKKDGTADMRYKANKVKAKPTPAPVKH
jgi:hypothetical protein